MENNPKEIILEKWKGKGGMQLTKCDKGYIVKEPRKVKETGEIEYIEHIVPFINVSNLNKIIGEHCQLNIQYGYKYLVRKVIEHYKLVEETGIPLEVLMEAFNGGKNRAKYYFPLLYYPLKVLEAEGLIVYFGRGGVMRV